MVNGETQYWINKEGENVGPYSLPEIGEMFNDGDCSNTDPVCKVGGEEWSSVGQLLELNSAREKSKEGFKDTPNIILAGDSRMSLNSTLTAILFFLLLVGAGLYLYVQLRPTEPSLSVEAKKKDNFDDENIVKLANEAKEIALFEERKGLFVDRKEGAPCNDWVRYYYSDGQSLAGLINFENGKAIFAHTWMPSGTKSFDTTLQQGSGSVVSYFENGSKREDSKYRGGVLNGVRLKYYENGQKSIEEPMMNGELHGQAVAWEENGQKIEEVFYLSGLKSGPYSIWAEDGQKMEEGSFRNGKPDGKRTQWSNDGTERTEEFYENGELVSNPGAEGIIIENGVEKDASEDLVLTGLLELAGEEEAWMEKARSTHEAVRFVMERFEKGNISGGEIFSDLALGLFQYSREQNGDLAKVESALGWIRNQWGISILLLDGKFLLSELPDSVNLGPVTWGMTDYAGDYLGSLRGESRDFVVSDIRNLFSSIGIELGTEEQMIRGKVERQIWEVLSLDAEVAKSANLELKNGVLMFTGTQEKKIKKIDPNGNSIFEIMEEEVSYHFNDRIQSMRMGPFLDVLDEARVAFEEMIKGNLTIRKYAGLSVFSDLSLPEGERIIYPNITIHFAGVGAINETTLVRAIKVELGEPVNEPLSDNHEGNALPF